MAKWQLQDAKAKFSKVVDDAVAKGPQIVTKRGVDTAVVVSMADWRESQRTPTRTWKEVLLGTVRDSRFRFPSAGKASGAKAPVFD